MFIGHFGAGFGAKAVARKVSLGTLLLAAQFIDLLWPTFILLGVEQVRIVPGATAVTPLLFEHYPGLTQLAGRGGLGIRIEHRSLFAAEGSQSCDRARRMVLCQNHNADRQFREMGVVGIGRIPVAYLRRQSVRLAAAKRRGDSLGRATAMAAGHLGLLAGPASYGVT